jgi:hypothetical protein
LTIQKSPLTGDGLFVEESAMIRCNSVCFGLILLVLPIAGCTSSTSSKIGAEKGALKGGDLKWARSVGEDFLRAVKGSDGKSAYALLSADYRDRLPEQERKQAQLELSPFTRFIGGGSVPINAWSITGEELAPNGGEAKFTGTVTYNSGLESKNYPFSLLVTRGKDSDLWRVNLFIIQRD